MTALETQIQPPAQGTVDYKLEVLTIPVSDVDRAKAFYASLGWREDGDFSVGADFRVLQFTPPGSNASIIFGHDVTDAEPGSVQGLLLAVPDVEAARDDLLARGIEVSEVFHDTGGIYHHAGTAERVLGPSPDRSTYGSYATFRDPDGNEFLLQEVTQRLPGRAWEGRPAYDSVEELAEALRRAEAAHGEHERRTGEPDADWPTWYATYMAREQDGGELPA